MAQSIGFAPDTAMLQMQQAALARAQSAGAAGKSNPADLPAIRKAASDFESVFASEMLSHMFSGIGTNGMFGGGHGEEMFRSLLVDQYGKALARSGTLGIADQVAAQMIKAQGGH
jgi:Rod binding domain-containing protein